MNNKGANTYQYGTTVRFECTFFNFSGIPINPEMVKIIVYDYKYNIIFNGIGLKTAEDGQYFYDYTTEMKEQKLFYEWYGEIDGKPSLKRGEFMTKFI
jgi:hypothetical protein